MSLSDSLSLFFLLSSALCWGDISIVQLTSPHHCVLKYTYDVNDDWPYPFRLWNTVAMLNTRQTLYYKWLFVLLYPPPPLFFCFSVVPSVINILKSLSLDFFLFFLLLLCLCEFLFSFVKSFPCQAMPKVDFVVDDNYLLLLLFSIIYFSLYFNEEHSKTQQL